MTPDHSPDRPDEELDAMQRLWTSHEPAPLAVDLEALSARARKLDRRLRWRNGIEVFAAGALSVAALALAAFVVPEPFTRAGLVLMALGALVVARSFVVRGRAPLADPSAEGMSYLAAYRAELDHQIELLGGVARWYLGPLVPGYLLMGLGPLLATHSPLFEGDVGLTRLWWALSYYGGGLLGAAMVVWVNRIARRELITQRDALGAESSAAPAQKR